MKQLCMAAAALVLMSPLTWAQISRPTEAELNAAPPQFQDLVHGRSDKLIQVGPGGRPPAAAAVAAVNPSKDPHDFSGNWSRAGGGPVGRAESLAPGGGAGGGGGDSDRRPGKLATTAIDANRMCLVSLGVNLAPMKVYQSASQLTFVYGNELRARRIYFSGAHAAKRVLTYNGDSIARWEGDTLVVDTINIKGVITLLGFDGEVGAKQLLLATPALHVIERISKSADGQQLRDTSTWEDTTSGAAPYSMTTVLSYAADAPAYDFECEDVGDKFGPNYGGGAK